MGRGKWGRRNNNPNYKKSAKIVRFEGKNIRQEIQTTVRSYRNRPHVSTGESPNKLVFGRELNGRLPAKLSKQTVRESVQRRDAEFKQKCKTYADNGRRTKASNIGIGDKVLIEQDKMDGLSPRYNPEPFVVVPKKGSRCAGRQRCAGTRLSANR